MKMEKFVLSGKGAGFGKVFLRLAGKADDQIGGKGHVGERGTEGRNRLRRKGRAVLPAHKCENAVGAALNRKVKVVAKGRNVGNLREKGGNEKGRVEGAAQCRESRKRGG